MHSYANMSYNESILNEFCKGNHLSTCFLFLLCSRFLLIQATTKIYSNSLMNNRKYLHIWKTMGDLKSFKANLLYEIRNILLHERCSSYSVGKTIRFLPYLLYKMTNRDITLVSRTFTLLQRYCVHSIFPTIFSLILIY